MLEPAEISSSANSYAIVAKLATGGMAEIFLARTESAAKVERYVVLKRVLQHRATDITFVHMFLDEARLAAQLQHPNIAQVYDTGKLGDSYFFTMEYVHGETVREVLHRAYALGLQIPIGVALTIVANTAAGLQHAHERIGVDGKPLGIVHRDVSPSNLMITYEGNVKVVDFGVAKATLRSQETQSGSIKGKIGYMSPEQCRSGVVDQRCDLFSLGIVMWELLVGERLFKRATDFESMEAVVLDPSPPPSSRRPEVPAELDAIVLKLLAKNPADRYQSASDLLDEIDTFALRAGHSLSVPAVRRFVRELFGQRPEPWVEMRIRDATPEVVTVTGAPSVGSNLDIDTQLERVVDLSVVAAARAEALPPLTQTSATVADPVMARGSTRLAMRPSSPLSLVADEPPVASEPPPRRGRITIAATALAVIGVAVVVYAMSRSSEEPAAPVKPAPIAAAPADATEPPPVEPPPAEPPPAEIDPPKPSATEPAAKPDLAASLQASKLADVVEACGDAALLAANATTCTLAACRAHQVDKARRWAQKITANRHAVTAACAKAGVTLEPRAVKVERPRHDPPRHDPPRHDPPKPPPPPPPKPKCDPDDPMSCRQ